MARNKSEQSPDRQRLIAYGNANYEILCSPRGRGITAESLAAYTKLSESQQEALANLGRQGIHDHIKTTCGWNPDGT